MSQERTDAQKAASRENGKLGGTKSPHISCLNRQWHGFRGSHVVTRDEKMEEYLAFSETIYADYQPEGTYEYYLVKRIADRMWELERAQRLKKETWEKAEYRDIMERELVTLEGYETSIERSLMRLDRAMTRSQERRAKVESRAAQEGQSPPEPPPVLETEPGQWVGPYAAFFPSEGEEAVHKLTLRAKHRLREFNGQSGRIAFQHYIEDQADEALFAEEADDPGGSDPDLGDTPDQNREASWVY